MAGSRIAIVEYLMSAGGLRRVLLGLAGAFLEIPEARGWDITFLLGPYDSAHQRATWPADLAGPGLRVEWLGEVGPLSRELTRLAHFQRFGGLRYLRGAAGIGARALRGMGPIGLRRLLGDPRALIEDASRRFDLLCFAYPTGLEAPALHCPVVTTPQDFNFKFFLVEGSRDRRVQEAATRSWLERSDRILLTSHAMLAEMGRFYPAQVGKAQVVHLGLDRDLPPPSNEVERVRVERGLPQRFALVAGWVMPHKNQLAVVEAMARLRERGLSIPVVFVGPNAVHLTDAPVGLRRAPYAREVKAALARHGFVHGRDFFAPGYVSDAEIRCLHHMATLYLLPSLYEGFGLPSLEALRAGCPTVVSDIPPLQEQNRELGGIVPTFDPGDAVALADRIAWVLEHGEEARAAALLAAERIPRIYDWRKTARSYLAHFAEVIEDHRRASPARPPPPAGRPRPH